MTIDECIEVAEKGLDGADAAQRSVAELSDAELLAIFPGSTIERERTDVEIAAEVIRCSLAGHDYVIGRWWPAKRIHNGLARAGITDDATIASALELLGVEVRKQGAGSRWRLDRFPEMTR